MFDTDMPGSVFAAVSPPADVAASAAEPTWPVFRPDTRGGDFSDTADYIRRYYDEHPAA